MLQEILEMTEAEQNSVLHQRWPRHRCARAMLVGPDGQKQEYRFVGNDIDIVPMKTGEWVFDEESDPDGFWKEEQTRIFSWKELGYRNISEFIIALNAAAWNAAEVGDDERLEMFDEDTY